MSGAAVEVVPLIGRRCLLSAVKGYSSGVHEFRIEEVSPSGNWVKLMTLHGQKFWKPVTEVSLVEVLKDLRPEKPPP